MTTSSRNYNVLALRGQDFDDMDVVRMYNLDPSVAYTPAINEAAAEAQVLGNKQWHMEQGKTEAEANALANNEKRSVLATVDKLIKKSGKRS